jgi:hypothetical protein
MFVTHKPHGVKPRVKGAQGPAGQPNPLAGQPHKSIPCPKVHGDREEWPAGHMDGRPAIHHLQTNSIKSVEAPLDLYIRILTVEFRTHTTLFL